MNKERYDEDLQKKISPRPSDNPMNEIQNESYLIECEESYHENLRVQNESLEPKKPIQNESYLLESLEYCCAKNEESYQKLNQNESDDNENLKQLIEANEDENVSIGKKEMNLNQDNSILNYNIINNINQNPSKINVLFRDNFGKENLLLFLENEKISNMIKKYKKISKNKYEEINFFLME